jgi:hypothetical protein
MEANFNDKTLSSAMVRGPYPSVNTSFDPPWILLDTTFKMAVADSDNIGWVY